MFFPYAGYLPVSIGFPFITLETLTGSVAEKSCSFVILLCFHLILVVL